MSRRCRAKVTIFHATGSATNPYVEITISNDAVAAHKSHQDGQDIIPAPPWAAPATLLSRRPRRRPAPLSSAS